MIPAGKDAVRADTEREGERKPERKKEGRKEGKKERKRERERDRERVALFVGNISLILRAMWVFKQGVPMLDAALHAMLPCMFLRNEVQRSIPCYQHLAGWGASDLPRHIAVGRPAGQSLHT